VLNKIFSLLLILWIVSSGLLWADKSSVIQETAALREQLKTSDPSQRIKAIVGVLNRQSGEPESGEAVAEILLGAKADPVDVARATRLEMDEPSEDARRTAVMVLSLNGYLTPEAVPVLKKGLKDSAENVRKMAIWVMKTVAPRGAEAIPDLVSNLPNARNFQDKSQIIEALERFGDSAHLAVPELIHILKGEGVKDFELGQVAAQALGNIAPGDPEVITALQQALKSVSASSTPCADFDSNYHIANYQLSLCLAMDPAETKRQRSYVEGSTEATDDDFSAFERHFTQKAITPFHVTMKLFRDNELIIGRAVLPLKENPWGLLSYHYALQKMTLSSGRTGYLLGWEGGDRSIFLDIFDHQHRTVLFMPLAGDNESPGLRTKLESWVLRYQGDDKPEIILRERTWRTNGSSEEFAGERYKAYFPGSKNYRVEQLSKDSAKKWAVDMEP
jgi:hypothetical protein